MFCLVFPQSRLSVVTIIFYTCVWIPFFQIKQALLRLIRFVSGTTCQPMQSFTIPMECLEGACYEQFDNDLPVVRYEELDCTYGRVDELCSVCLGEFEIDEEVSQLSGCGHVFHLRCIKSWLDRNKFTCPLCRTSVYLNVADVCHGKCGIINTM